MEQTIFDHLLYVAKLMFFSIGALIFILSILRLCFRKLQNKTFVRIFDIITNWIFIAAGVVLAFGSLFLMSGV